MSCCPICKAPLGEGVTCEDLFNRMLAIEWALIGDRASATTQAAFLGSGTGMLYARAHFFAVGAYQLQHPDRLTADVLLGLHAAIADVLAGRRSVADIRAENRRRFEGPAAVAHKSFAGPDPALGAWPRIWPVTAADCSDVAPPDYPAAVERLAAATVAAIDAVRSASPSPPQSPPPAPPRRPADRRRR